MDMDLVYLWCDDADAEWSDMRKKHLPKEKLDKQVVCKGRFVQNDELKYSLRSVEKYMPWVNNIYIVSTCKMPQWLNVNHPKIKIISEKSLLGKYNPVFNSNAIETFLADIEGLSENFIYMNDDNLLAAPIKPQDLIDEDGKIICRMIYSKNSERLTPYCHTIINMQKISAEKFGYECSYHPHHNLDVYNKTAFKQCNKMCAEFVEQTRNNRFHTAQDWQRVLISYYMLATGSGKLKIINAYKMSWLQWLKHNLLNFGKIDSLILPLNFKTKKYYNKLNRYKPKFLCMEDNEYSNDDDRARGKAFLQLLFPYKSEFEN